ncbi:MULTISPECIES: styrene monooxygenase/indole monooxygenase family protein [unclassified Streptomyces]|uniref:styrene monooxygenase/indole monooxygenase family protein n=1 Tax=unclassified Streptomyces TaxID=2593676 RepID=UPI00278BC83E|nr:MULTISPECIES: styrene monooxygenase/indole monooxygenase family protein [unclassified Streptomyces]
MPDIGIVGTGVAGLHLGLLLREQDIDATIYTDRAPEAAANGRLPATVAHHAPTLMREAALGVQRWPGDTYGYGCHHHYVGGPTPLIFRGDFRAPSRAVDHRLYLPALAGDFQERGGDVVVRQVAPADLEHVAARHDLLVVASGRGPLAGLFPTVADSATVEAPRRLLCAGLYHGVAPTAPKGVTLSIAPGRGEVIEIPLYSGAGHVTALLFECVPGGGADALCAADAGEDQQRFLRALLDELAHHHPTVFERVAPADFGPTGPLDVVRTAITPTVRADHTPLPGGRHALALGDAHTTLDPIVGQGANSASYSAQIVADAIAEDLAFDELFCRRVARRRAEFVLGAARWSELMTRPPAEHILRLLGAMSAHQSAADEFTDNFAHPDRQWRIVATAQRTQEFLRRHGAA